MKNITPKQLRCFSGACPAVYELEDGRLLIVGRNATFDELHLCKPKGGSNESAIVIDRALLSDLVQAPSETDGAQCVHLGSEWEFHPDWELDAVGKLTVALTLALSKHIPDWPGATDEQLAAVAVDIATDEVHESRERLSIRAENARLKKALELAARIAFASAHRLNEKAVLPADTASPLVETGE